MIMKFDHEGLEVSLLPGMDTADIMTDFDSLRVSADECRDIANMFARMADEIEQGVKTIKLDKFGKGTPRKGRK